MAFARSSPNMASCWVYNYSLVSLRTFPDSRPIPIPHLISPVSRFSPVPVPPPPPPFPSPLRFLVLFSFAPSQFRSPTPIPSHPIPLCHHHSISPRLIASRLLRCRGGLLGCCICCITIIARVHRFRHQCRISQSAGFSAGAAISHTAPSVSFFVLFGVTLGTRTN